MDEEHVQAICTEHIRWKDFLIMAMDVEEFTIEGSVQGKFDTILVKKIVKALKEVRPTFKRELLGEVM